MGGYRNHEHRHLMTREKTVTLGDERDRLDARLDQLVDQLSDADKETNTAQALQREAIDLNECYQAVCALIDRYGEDDEVTVRELDGRLWGEAWDRVDTVANSKAGPGGVPGTSLNVFAAQALVDAPFLNGQDPDNLTDMTTAVGEQTPAPGVQKWLDNLREDVSRVDTKNSKGLLERFAENASRQETTSSTTP